MRPAMSGSTTRSASPRRVAASIPTGPAALADACARRGVPLLTFSSDLVFGGDRDVPFVESDPLRPLNVYGRSKAEAEARVLEALPSALVVRTSAFFGPWDEHNFVTIALRELAAGRPFVAAEDAVISPTYVPDLVNASLDLLIDGERGLVAPGERRRDHVGRSRATGGRTGRPRPGGRRRPARPRRSAWPPPVRSGASWAASGGRSCRPWTMRSAGISGNARWIGPPGGRPSPTAIARIESRPRPERRSACSSMGPRARTRVSCRCRRHRKCLRWGEPSFPRLSPAGHARRGEDEPCDCFHRQGRGRQAGSACLSPPPVASRRVDFPQRGMGVRDRPRGPLDLARSR